MIENGLRQITSRFSIDSSKQIGKGSFGSVYKGRDNLTGETIAIKHYQQPKNFQVEIQILLKLSHLKHKNIVGFIDYEIKRQKEEIKDVYIFMQLCSGDLKNLIEKGLKEQKVLDLFRQFVEGMCYLNQNKIMHRDLKPDNILIGSNGQIKICDFGLARIDDELKKSKQKGNFLYACPQIFTNKTNDYDLNCDVWGAGLILYEMLTGRHPFKPVVYQENEWKMFEKGLNWLVYPKNMHPQWEYITNIMLTYDYKKRPHFHQILEILKKLDENSTMKKEIINGIKVDENSNEAILRSFLFYKKQKLDILVDFKAQLNCGKYEKMSEILKELITFLSVSWYVAKIKKLIMDLGNKSLVYPKKQGSNEQDYKLDLIMDMYKNIFENKLTNYRGYLQEQIIPKLIDKQSSPEKLYYLKNFDKAYQLVHNAKQNKYDMEETYEKLLIKVLAFHQVMPSYEKLAAMKVQQNQIYCKILLAGLLNSEFPDEKYQSKGFIEDKTKILETENQAELLNFIYKLMRKIKVQSQKKEA